MPPAAETRIIVQCSPPASLAQRLYRALSTRLRPLLPARLMPPSAIEISEKAGVRYLHFSSDWIQGAMRLRRPNALELLYTRDMMAGLLLREAPWPREVLLIGLGTGSLVKFFYHYLPWTRLTVVEIDPQVEIVARLHFRLPSDPLRLRIVLGDGADYMRHGDSHFDAILVDGFDEYGRAGALETLPFYLACRSRLSAQGLLTVNLLARQRGFPTSAAHIAQAFDDRVLIFPSSDTGNAIALANAGDAIDLTENELATRTTHWRDETGLNLLPTIARLRQAGNLSGGRLRL